MKTIWKYELPVKDDPIVLMKKDAHIIDIQEQCGKLIIWAKVDSTNENEERCFRIYGTGHNIQDEKYLYYMKSIQMSSGFVWHIFEKMRDAFGGLDKNFTGVADDDTN